MRRLHAALCVLVCTFAAVSAASARPSSSDSMRELIKDCDALTGEESANACQQLLKLRKYKGHTLSILYNNLGVTYSRMSEHEQAIEAFSNAMRVDPRYLLPRTNRARSLAAIARFADAINDMDAVIKLAPTAEHYAMRADFRERDSDLDGAKSDYSEAIKKQPKVAHYYNSRAMIFGKLSDHAEAIEDFSRAIQLNPRDPSFYYARGVSWSNAGKCDQAVPDYTKAIELSPRFSSAYNNRGVCLSRAGKRSEAIADYEAALKWDPGNEKARGNLAGIKNTVVPLHIPPPLEVPRFAIPPVRELLTVPEYSVIETAPEPPKKE